MQLETQKASHAQRIGGAPGDRALGVEPLEVPEQQHAKVAPRRQTRAPNLVGIESLAERFNVARQSWPAPKSDSVACRRGALHSAAGLAWPPTWTPGSDGIVVYPSPCAILWCASSAVSIANSKSHHPLRAFWNGELGGTREVEI